MTICDYCKENASVIYICSSCGGKFCKHHKNPEDHDCLTENKGIAEKETEHIDIPAFPPTETTDTGPETQAHILGKENSSGSDFFSFMDSVAEQVMNEEYDEEISEPMEAYTPPPELQEPENHEPLNELNDQDLNESETQPTANDIDITPSVQDAPKVGLRKFFTLNHVLIILLIVFIATTGFLYLDNKKYSDLNVDFYTLFNSTVTLQNSYNDLLDQNNELREAYSDLYGNYSELLSRYTELKTKYEDTVNYNITMSLENDKTIVLEPRGNHSTAYAIPFSGYINMSYTATGETFVWIGSTAFGEFYSRLPQSPDTADELNFLVPVMPDIIIYFVNPSESESITITYTIKYTY